jgi:hypothetical protein
VKLEVLHIMSTRTLILVALGTGAFLSSGCSTMSDTAKGAGIGGAIGTGAGLAVGAATGNPRTGAVVGGLLGAGTGAAIGNASDNEKADRREFQQAVATAQAQRAAGRMGMIDVVQMTQQGQSEGVIINQIRVTHSTFQLSANDLNYLKQCGVSNNVIMEMQNAQPGPTVATAQPVYVRPGPAMVYQPAPVYVYGGYGRPYYRRYWW